MSVSTFIKNLDSLDLTNFSEDQIKDLKKGVKKLDEKLKNWKNMFKTNQVFTEMFVSLAETNLITDLKEKFDSEIVEEMIKYLKENTEFLPFYKKGYMDRDHGGTYTRKEIYLIFGVEIKKTINKNWCPRSSWSHCTYWVDGDKTEDYAEFKEKIISKVSTKYRKEFQEKYDVVFLPEIYYNILFEMLSLVDEIAYEIFDD